MSTKEMITSGIRAALDRLDFNYQYDEARDVFQFGYKLECKLSSTRFFVVARNSDYLIKAVSPIGGQASDDEMMTELAKLVAQINYKLIQGNFDLDLSDGEISFREGVECAGLDEIPDVFVISAIAIAIKMWNNYGDCFLGVIFNGLNADEALKLEKE